LGINQGRLIRLTERQLRRQKRLLKRSFEKTVEKTAGERRPLNWLKPCWRAKMGEVERTEERGARRLAEVGPARKNSAVVAVVVAVESRMLMKRWKGVGSTVREAQQARRRTRRAVG
jgi:hypothetical protein